MNQLRRAVRTARAVRLLVEQPAPVTLLLGLVVTATLFAAIRSEEQQRMQADFERLADTRIEAIHEGLNDAVDVVATVNRAFATMQPIGRAQFAAFTRPMIVQNPQLHMIAYQRIVDDGERAAFEADRRRQMPGFEIRAVINGRLVTSPQRPNYRVLDYLMPMEGNEAAFGLDAASRRLPGPRLGTRQAHCPGPDRDNQSGVLGQREEARRQQQAELGMAPAQQGFDADDLAAAQVELRLVMQLELAALERIAQGALEVQALLRLLVHFRLVEQCGQ